MFKPIENALNFKQKKCVLHTKRHCEMYGQKPMTKTTPHYFTVLLVENDAAGTYFAIRERGVRLPHISPAIRERVVCLPHISPPKKEGTFWDQITLCVERFCGRSRQD